MGKLRLTVKEPWRSFSFSSLFSSSSSSLFCSTARRSAARMHATRTSASFCTSLSRWVRCALRQAGCVVCYGGYPAWILVVGGGGGTGYTYTGGKGGLAIQAMVEADLAPILVGKDARRVERLYEDMTWHVHYVARGGVASFAVSAVDIALWDLKCKCAGIVTYGAVRHSVWAVDVCSAQC